MKRSQETRRDFLRKAATAASVGATLASGEILAASDESTVDPVEDPELQPEDDLSPAGQDRLS